MATRKKPETEPILDSESEYNAPTVELDKEKFLQLLRWTYDASAGRARQLSSGIRVHLNRLGVSRHKTKAPSRPKGDAPANSDIQSVLVWASKVSKGDKNAVAQLKSLDAACKQRGV